MISTRHNSFSTPFQVCCIILLILLSGPVCNADDNGRVVSMHTDNRVELDIGSNDGIDIGMRARLYYVDSDFDVRIYIAVIRIVEVSSDGSFGVIEKSTSKISPGLKTEWYKDLQEGSPVTSSGFKGVEYSRTITEILPGGIELELVLIPAGSFRMGSPMTEVGREIDEGPVHQVSISRSYYIGRYEVTQSQYAAVMGTEPNRYKWDSQPIDNVNWHEAVAFCKTLSEITGKRFRLPTEAEWEYAARAGTQTRYYWGDTDSNTVVKQYAWSSKRRRFIDEKDEDGNWVIPDRSARLNTSSVGQMEANTWGLYDMSGNVWEWCHDWYCSQYYSYSPNVDPRGPANGIMRIVRGGNWDSAVNELRSANRNFVLPKSDYNSTGFRVVRQASRIY